MSKTISVGVVGPDHWTYMSNVMAGIFKKSAENRRLKKSDIPKGILADATDFSLLVLKGNTTTNPLAGLNAQNLAVNVVQEMKGFCSLADQEKLFLGCSLIALLGSSDKINEINNPVIVPTLQFMSHFFSKLHQMGEEEAFRQRTGNVK